MARVAKVKSSPSQRPGLCGKAETRSLQGGGPSCYRYRLADPALEASIQRHGMLMPVLVSDEVRPVVIAGHKRLHAARALKLKEIPVLIAARTKPQDALLLNLVSNWKEACPDMDRAQALGTTARELGFNEKELLLEVMPLLGLPDDKATLELYRKLDRFPRPLKDLIVDGRLPIRGVSFLMKFSEKDQEYFAKEIGSRMRLTSSQLLQAGEWLSDMLRGTGKSLGDFCRSSKVLEGLHVPGMDPRIKADKFFARLKRLRSPHYSKALAQFEEKSGSVFCGAKGIRLEPVQGFEEPGFELHARVRTPEELELLLQKIAEKRSSLNSLFEIML